ncbi:WecB/TagA/CpsF family glycosyltransferase [Roseomonas sp. SSH11]|uniref:WecB/TagA/CpsF family glycosyltransferase n=1 Tax=Pararoseomonas baculiformis TaxID=2820812 RepID=A0ABS4AJM4_9PROT|nr:WecB/TagA/CpsF family glycosyltransferase [Pararoseomonas baculiformis]MBP0447239.1 WecB/TagA/CpsF family glycosyltransferase [Pararoseomonas baculiformis]
MPPEIRLLGRAAVTPLGLAEATEAIAARDPALPFAYVVSVNAQILLIAEDPATGLRAAHEEAWLRLNDSGILLRLHRWALGETAPVAAGSDLCLTLLASVIRPDDPITIIGGGPQIAAALRERHGLRRIAQHEPPMGYIDKPEAREAAIRFIEENPARFTFVATGAPRSERLMQAVARRGKATGVGLAVGSGLLFAVDLTPRAPVWMRRKGLEWLHRAWTEPARLGRRYAADLLPLLRLAIAARRGNGRA